MVLKIGSKSGPLGDFFPPDTPAWLHLAPSESASLQGRYVLQNMPPGSSSAEPESGGETGDF